MHYQNMQRTKQIQLHCQHIISNKHPFQKQVYCQTFTWTVTTTRADGGAEHSTKPKAGVEQAVMSEWGTMLSTETKQGIISTVQQERRALCAAKRGAWSQAELRGQVGWCKRWSQEVELYPTSDRERMCSKPSVRNWIMYWSSPWDLVLDQNLEHPSLSLTGSRSQTGAPPGSAAGTEVPSGTLTGTVAPAGSGTDICMLADRKNSGKDLDLNQAWTHGYTFSYIFHYINSGRGTNDIRQKQSQKMCKGPIYRQVTQRQDRLRKQENKQCHKPEQQALKTSLCTKAPGNNLMFHNKVCN